MTDGIPSRPWSRIIGFVALFAGIVPIVLMPWEGPVWLITGICVFLIFVGSALLCGAWEFCEVHRREARSREFDGQAQGTIIASEIGPAYADTSPLMNLAVFFTDQGGQEQRVFLRKVVPQNALHRYAVGQPVIVRYATAAPNTDLTIAPLS